MNIKLKQQLIDILIDSYPFLDEDDDVPKIKNFEGLMAHVLKEDDILFEWMLSEPIHAWGYSLQNAMENYDPSSREEYIEFTGEWTSK